MAGREKDIDEILKDGENPKAGVTPEPDDLAIADAPADPVPPLPPKPVNWRLWLGGGLIVIAAAAGWAGSQWLVVTPLETRVAAVETNAKAFAVEFATLRKQVDDAAAQPAGVSPEELSTLGEEVAALQAALDATRGEFGKLGERMTALERAASAAPAGTPPDAALAGLQAQIDQLTGDLKAKADALEARLAALESQPDPEPVAAAARPDAVTEVIAAIERGQSFAAPLLALREARPDAPEIEVLAAHATGVLTLDALQAGFPEAARVALSDARAADVTEGETSGRLGAFLKDQLGMRSLAPQEGADADAVLSRAEAKLSGGDLDGALGELANLPDAARPAMADWTEDASARLAVLQAVAALSASGN